MQVFLLCWPSFSPIEVILWSCKTFDVSETDGSDWPTSFEARLPLSFLIRRERGSVAVPFFMCSLLFGLGPYFLGLFPFLFIVLKGQNETATERGSLFLWSWVTISFWPLAYKTKEILFGRQSDSTGPFEEQIPSEFLEKLYRLEPRPRNENVKPYSTWVIPGHPA